MTYRTLAHCVADLERTGQLVRITDLEVDPFLELASIQRRAYRNNSPALLFTRVRGTPFPVLANLFGTMERTRFLFRSTLRRVETLLRLKADPIQAIRRPWQALSVPGTLYSMLPRKVRSGPVMQGKTRLSHLPQVVSWPLDGGAYVTLPQVYSEAPGAGGVFSSNLGMYRVQISGNSYEPDREAGLHYQIHRGIGAHHLAALERGQDLPVNIFVGGPPAMTLAAVMPLPEGIPELCFAGALAGRRIPMAAAPGMLPVAAEADFCIRGRLRLAGGAAVTKPEGPFGDHLGYYSLAHDFPVLQVEEVLHRPDAVWPFTSVGRPPQEDTVFGAFIHELTAALVPTVFSGVREVHAVDAAGVHPLLLALGSERYTPFATERTPQELLTCGLALLGSTQTSLAKYLLIAARGDAPGLSAHDVPAFFRHMLERTDFSRDLHFITRTTVDTLDYSGTGLNQGSKLLWAAAGRAVRTLCTRLPRDFSLPEEFGDARLFAPGIILCRGPAHAAPRGEQDRAMQRLATHLEHTLPRNAAQDALPEEPALLVVVDDVAFSAAGWENFLWTAFTRSDPAADVYGPGEALRSKHWGCQAPLLLDARSKSFHAPPLREDPHVERRIDSLAGPGGPLRGLV